MHIVQQINGKVLWANNHLLFWVSLFPFATGWMGENHFSTWAVAIYGVVLMMAGIAYYILVRIFVNNDVNNNWFAKAIVCDYIFYSHSIGFCTFLYSLQPLHYGSINLAYTR